MLLQVHLMLFQLAWTQHRLFSLMVKNILIFPLNSSNLLLTANN